jgi:hypothetical protein
MFLRGAGVTSLRQRLQRLPAPAIDAGLALAVAVVLTITIRVSPPEGRRPDALAYALGLTIAALLLVRRRWPLAVLLVSAACRSTTCSTTPASAPRCRWRWRWPPPGAPATCDGRCW